MTTVATPTKTAGVKIGTLGAEAEYTLLLDTTTAAGLMTVDLTDDFGYIHSAIIGGELAATSSGYQIKVEKPALATALTSTNLILSFWESAADGDALDPVNAVDLSAVITGLTLHVIGKPALDASWA